MLQAPDEVEKMERKDLCKYSLKRSEKVKTLTTKNIVKLNSKGEASLVFNILFYIIFLANGCNFSFDNCKGHHEL